eukprot:NODE_6374_length_1677_cov_5.143226.p1 GENE.NODE_6374_length_1677_cov_5.143226~~NODE_6374_length_1677_cov_5.143226.p1  ORF type:complete len:420 (-),score=81.21 NODE_6374_length_1677_cov_5.143226:335-1594(-)
MSEARETKGFSSSYGLLLNVDSERGLNAIVSEQQAKVRGEDSVFLGYGSNVPQQLELRKQIFGRPGPPFGGFGFFQPPAGVGFPEGLTAARIRELKLGEFAAMAACEPSIYSQRLQPIYDITGRMCYEAEVLLRCNNGKDSAPFEDVMALSDPNAPADAERVYAAFMAHQAVTFLCDAFQLEKLRRLHRIAVNFRKHDLRPEGEVFKAVSAALAQLCESDRFLVLSKTCIEVVEDQPLSEALVDHLAAWRGLGYAYFALDDIIGDNAAAARRSPTHFHTHSATKPYFHHFKSLKVDMDWASLVFLSHPAWKATDEEAMLASAKEDRLQLPHQPPSEVPYSALLDEFAAFALETIARKMQTITIELSLSADHKNNAYAAARLQERGLDCFGEHASFFLMQGGATGAKAFTAAALTMHSAS